MQALDICSIESSVPEWFADWVRIWLKKDDYISKKVSALLSNDELKEALAMYDYTLHKNTEGFVWTHRGNNRIH